MLLPNRTPTSASPPQPHQSALIGLNLAAAGLLLEAEYVFFLSSTSIREDAYISSFGCVRLYSLFLALVLTRAPSTQHDTIRP